MTKRLLLLTSLSVFLLSLSACGDASTPNSVETQTTQQSIGVTPEGMPPGGPGGGPGMGMPPGGGMPGGLPPNAEELRIEYPEFIAALEAMQDLDPEARRAAMDELFTEHPEWRELLQPPGGAGMPPGGGQGGPMGAPPAAPVASPAA